MKGIFLTLFAIAALAVAGAKTYTVDLLHPAMLGGSELQAGQYRIQVDGDKVVVHVGKTTAEAPVKTETAPTKYRDTSVRVTEAGGVQHITEICIGGTTTRLVLSD
ncbi:MAG TPA: hypothetical protein VMU19_00245 [Bryobacteraceae bacterium]|nr:hypothetical protein [Bryobacteraceae bacterium]